MALAPEYWESKAEELSRERLDNVRETAKAWAATITGLLGVFGAVAIVSGPATIDKLAGPARVPVAVLVTVGGLLALWAVVATAIAAQGFPTEKRAMTGQELAAWTIEESRRASSLLAVGRLAGMVAGTLVFAAGTVALWSGALAEEASNSGLMTLVRTETGALQCGELIRPDGAPAELSLKVGTEDFPLGSDVAHAEVVEACP